MSWLQEIAPSVFGKKVESKIPAGVWIKCNDCGEVLHSKDLKKALKVCTCGYHFRVNCYERLEFLLDKDSFHEMDSNLSSKPAHYFSDTQKTGSNFLKPRHSYFLLFIDLIQLLTL